MGKTYPPRPPQDFKIASVQWNIDSEANHRRAGFPEVPFEVIQPRFWQLLSFLSQQDYLANPVAASLNDVVPATALMNHDLNDAGYLFIQRYEGKWADRLFKDKHAETEWQLLQKWHAQFLAGQ